eukprot:gnl/MRDRNA2_/MRDRNA2_35996_c0_seq2.p1 gnl/MRDRNA2_/MRDRNA2_35996_c0~~gnl/MRDRNA2_/MRDRNA2_35996_c0_seq2.p1  ORF type:complete len:554 (-),score=171.01 gnl/MRDRNA2_/MRDRNA2_35996_c0_seq2:7-1623(-)
MAPPDEDPLSVAARDNDADKVRSLIAKKADVEKRVGAFAWTALHEAAGKGALDAMRVLLEENADVAANASDGETPLYLAAQEGQEEAIRLLVEYGADLGVESEDGETPLHAAVQHIGSKDLGHVSALLELKADPCARDSEGRDVFQHARIFTNRADELVTLLRQGDGREMRWTCEEEAQQDMSAGLRSALRTACRRGQAHHVRQMLELNPAPDVPALAQACLLSAAAGGNLECATALVEAKANPCVSAGLDAHANPSVSPGATPLIAAAEEGRTPMVRWLVQQKADVAATSEIGATALMAASMRGSGEAVEMLLEALADPNHRAGGGWTALMVASQSGKQDVARTLLDAKASLEAINDDGAGARELATTNSHNELVKMLDTRAKLNSRRAKKTADKAASNGHVEDTRDLDQLLRDLGEKPSSGKKKKVQKDKVKGPAPVEVKEEEEEEPIEMMPAKAKCAPIKKEAQEFEATPEVITPEKKAEAKKRGKKKGADNEEKKIAVAKAKELRERLKEIQKIRRELDAEEVRLNAELEALDL